MANFSPMQNFFKKKIFTKVTFLASFLLFLFWLFLQYLINNWRLLHDPQLSKSVGYSWFLVKLGQPSSEQFLQWQKELSLVKTSTEFYARAPLLIVENQNLISKLAWQTSLVKYGVAYAQDQLYFRQEGIYLSRSEALLISPAPNFQNGNLSSLVEKLGQNWQNTYLKQKITLAADEVWLASPFLHSLDSRYFGAVKLSQIKGVVYVKF